MRCDFSYVVGDGILARESIVCTRSRSIRCDRECTRINRNITLATRGMVHLVLIQLCSLLGWTDLAQRRKLVVSRRLYYWCLKVRLGVCRRHLLRSSSSFPYWAYCVTHVLGTFVVRNLRRILRHNNLLVAASILRLLFNLTIFTTAGRIIDESVASLRSAVRFTLIMLSKAACGVLLHMYCACSIIEYDLRLY